MKIKCHYHELVPIGKIKPNPDNPNDHPNIQINGLEVTLKENEIRHPLIVSKQSGLLVCGHARLQVMKKLGLKKVPVVYQDFESKEKEFQFMVADNESQRKSWFNPLKFDKTIKALKIPKLNYKAFGIYDSIVKMDNKDDSHPKSDDQIKADIDNLDNLDHCGNDININNTDSEMAKVCPECGHKFF